MTEQPDTASREERTAVLVHVDAPQLPFLAGALQRPFTAVTRDGWSAVLVTDGIDPVALAAAGDPESLAVVLSSDGESRNLRVCPPLSALDDQREWGAQLDELAEATALRWGPAETDAAAVASIVSLCDLDPAATARLENYARTPSSPLLLESVLQLLGLPVIAAKIVEGQRELEDVEGVSHHEPRGLGLSLFDSASVEPSGSGLLSRVQRAYVRRPGILLALGGAELAVGAGLAGLAARGGRGCRVLGSVSALMLSDAAVQAALYAAVRARKTR
ncbi:hypothetical protein KVA01_19230 [Kocuria varians]|uniref:Uncharacterized protein n=1 Tax=Kocuria varians TaxID=1272 RepID=A0A4Y4D3K6_KOCVA|nr:hypothetical protein [Kocuria varians]GEC99768.1 hypothetical protein KVA01_19230 [Kocuria varians]